MLSDLHIPDTLRGKCADSLAFNDTLSSLIGPPGDGRLINAWAALKQGAELVKYQYPETPLGPFDIEINVTHCSICATDYGLIDNEYGFSVYPQVPGHEIVGIVTMVRFHAVDIVEMQQLAHVLSVPPTTGWRPCSVSKAGCKSRRGTNSIMLSSMQTLQNGQ